MAPQQPLLARRPSSDQSSHRDGIEEEDALLTGQNVRQGDSRWRRVREIAVFTWALIATVVVIILAVFYEQSRAAHSSNPQTSPGPAGKRNLIFMVSDGMGPTSLTLTRSFKQVMPAHNLDNTLGLDPFLIGQSRTRSTSSLVTDSAAGATAFSCGKKSYNGAISTLPDFTPCGTVMEAAKKAGYKTGLVVTTRITDATPAVFAAHVNKRDEEDRIAKQLLGDHPLGQVVDLMLGAGRCHFLPNSTEGSCRSDSEDMIARAKTQGVNYISSLAEFNGLNGGANAKLPLLGLFANEDIPYKIDRDALGEPEYPSLVEMSNFALRALSDATKDSDQGFFLMIEGSRIDHAGHANDPPAQVHEVLEFDDAFNTVRNFIEQSDHSTESVLVSTSDHETGGLATAKQLEWNSYPEYFWIPSAYLNATHSTEWLADEYGKFLKAPQTPGSASTDEDTRSYLRNLVPQYLSVSDVSSQELDRLVEAPNYSLWTFADIVSKRGRVGWTTHGHSGGDVNIYAHSSRPNAVDALAGNHENTDIGKFLQDYLAVDVDAVTQELKDALSNGKVSADWLGPEPEEEERLDGQTHMKGDHYTNDFAKHKRCSLCAGFQH